MFAVGDVAQLVRCLLLCMRPWVISWMLCEMLGICAREEEVKSILSYRLSLGLAWAIRNFLSQKNKEIEKEREKEESVLTVSRTCNRKSSWHLRMT